MGPHLGGNDPVGEGAIRVAARLDRVCDRCRGIAGGALAHGHSQPSPARNARQILRHTRSAEASKLPQLPEAVPARTPTRLAGRGKSRWIIVSPPFSGVSTFLTGC